MKHAPNHLCIRFLNTLRNADSLSFNNFLLEGGGGRGKAYVQKCRTRSMKINNYIKERTRESHQKPKPWYWSAIEWAAI